MDLPVHRWYLFPAREARNSFNDPSREAAKESKWLVNGYSPGRRRNWSGA